MTQYEAINAIQKVIESMPPLFKTSNDFFLCVSLEVAQHLFDEMHELTTMPKVEVKSGETFLYMGHKIKVA